jgi:hypothetical protein
MHALLHASAPDCPLRKFGILRGNGHAARFSPLGHLSIMVIWLPDKQFSLHQIQDAQPVRFLWHVQRVEERLRFHRCSVEIVGAYRNPIQCRVCLVARPSAKDSMVKFIATIKSIIDFVVCARPPDLCPDLCTVCKAAGPMYRMASMTASPLLDARELNGEHPRSATPPPIWYRRVDQDLKRS